MQVRVVTHIYGVGCSPKSILCRTTKNMQTINRQDNSSTAFPFPPLIEVDQDGLEPSSYC